MEDKKQLFASEMQKRRKALHLTQEELAKKIGTTKQMISKYEKGQRSPKISMANAIAAALGTTLNAMLGIELPDDDNSRLEALHQNPKLCILFDRQMRMPEKDIDFMLEVSARITKENYGE